MSLGIVYAADTALGYFRKYLQMLALTVSTSRTVPGFVCPGPQDAKDGIGLALLSATPLF